MRNTPKGYTIRSMKQDLKKRATHRAKIIEGQFKGLLKQIDNEAYCIDIMTQSLAIQRSLSSLNKLVMENHLRTHVTDMLNSDEAAVHEKAIAELLSIYELGNVRSK